MFLAQYGTSLNIWCVINCGLFMSVGIAFVIIGYMFPGVRMKEIDQAKLRANVGAGVTG